MSETSLSRILHDREAEIVKAYVKRMHTISDHYQSTPDEEMAQNARRSLHLLGELNQEGGGDEAREYIRHLCEQRLPRGFRLGEVMQAIFLLRDVVIPIVREVHEADRREAQIASDQLWLGLSRLALLWAESFMDLQQEILEKKDQVMRALSTPVIEIWEGILTLPLVGDVDEKRSRLITEDLLQSIITHQAEVVLIDITGIGSIDTRVIAQLVRTVSATELLGCRCCLVGIAPHVANTIVSLGVDLSMIRTYANLRQGLAEALHSLGLEVHPIGACGA